MSTDTLDDWNRRMQEEYDRTAIDTTRAAYRKAHNCTLTPWDESATEEERAELIARAVNSHAELVEACRAAQVRVHRECVATFDRDDTHTDVCRQLAAAIARAEGRE